MVLNDPHGLRSTKVAEEDLVDPIPGSAPMYRVEYSLRAHHFEEPQVERELERGEEERKVPKGFSFFLNPNCVSPLL
jgi:hypothetical protein